MAETPTASPNAVRRDRARRVAAEELTGLALQERGLTALLARQAGEAPTGGPRERLERHLERSRRHQRTFDAAVDRLRESRGTGELLAGVLRSGFAAIGTVGATAAQVATLPLAIVRRGGGEERLLENAGVEGGALANKLVILTALRRALTEAGEQPTLDEIEAVRADALDAWEELLEQTPELMSALVGARSHESSFDFRTAGAAEGVHS